MPDLFEILRGQIDVRRRLGRRHDQFLLLGSASGKLMRQSSESLAGRIIYHELTGLDLLETAPHDLEKLWMRGGFPESFLARSDGVSRAWRGSLVRTVLERDVPHFAPRLSA